jgi:hypothetical protein
MPTKTGVDVRRDHGRLPEARVSLSDLDKPEVFKTQTPEGKAARDAMWTEVKAS